MCMKKSIWIFFIVSFLVLVTKPISAQTYTDNKNPWIIGFGLNVIYDSGEGLNGLFEFKRNYNYHNPYRFSLEKRFARHYGIEVSANFNRLLKDKVINGLVLDEDIRFVAFDGMAKYYFTNMFLDENRSLFEGYVAGGMSANYYEDNGVLTINAATGLNFFISEEFRITGQVVAKFTGSGTPFSSNYLQFNLGCIIRLSNSSY